MLSGVGRGGEPHCRNAELWKSSRRLRGIPAPPGLLLLPQGQAWADTSQLRGFTLPFPSGNYCREWIAPDSVAGAWENTCCSGAVGLQYGKLEAGLVVTEPTK